MSQILIELDDFTIKRLNQVASPQARKRSEFIRAAIRKALDEVAEKEMERAYRAMPQETAEVDLDPETWAPQAPAKKRKSR